MLRLFVGLELAPPVRDVLLAAMGGVAGAHWQRDDQLHLTLRFIGEVDRHRAADVVAALGTINVTPFALELAGPGSFDRRGRIDTLWVGVSPQTEVSALAKRVNAALARVGIPPDPRAFVPHITVARGRSLSGVAGWPPAPIRRIGWTVSHFALFESVPTPEGSLYRILARWSDGSAPTSPARA